MKNIAWVALWIGLFTFLSVWVVTAIIYSKPNTAEQAILQCVKNNGVPIVRDPGSMAQTMTDCKIYKK